MTLTEPALPRVTPGEPVTAEGWNGLVTGLRDLYRAVIALGGAAVDVEVTGHPAPDVEVFAEPLGAGRPVQALPPFGARTRHQLVGLTEGSWRVHVTGTGCVPEIRDITVPRPEVLGVALRASGPVVPDLFNVPAQQALLDLSGAAIGVRLIVDTTGREVSFTTLPPEYANAPVLAQLPAAGTVLPEGGTVRLVVASALRREPVVVMPSLIGLSLAEAQQALEAVGLRVGRTDVRFGPGREQ